MKGRHLDLSSEPGDESSSAGGRSAAGDVAGKRFIGVHFTCCDVYLRVYINRDESGYDGRCPRCARSVQFKIGPGGTNHRFFTAS